MNALEIALVILVSIWTLIFVILAIAMIVFLSQVKKALDKINNILENAEGVSKGVSLAATGISSLFSKKGIVESVKKLASKKK